MKISFVFALLGALALSADAARVRTFLDEANDPALQCQLCDSVATVALRSGTAHLRSDPSAALEAVTSACSGLIGPGRDACETFVARHGVRMAADLAGGRHACASVCAEGAQAQGAREVSGNSGAADFSDGGREGRETTQASADDLVGGVIGCEICDFVLGEVEKLLGENSTEQDVIKILDDVCSKVPFHLADACDAFVAEYAPGIIQQIVNNEPPSKVCKALKVCPSSVAAAVPEEKASPIVCSICKLVLTEVEKIVGTNKTEAAIQKALDNVCEKLPKLFAAGCETLVDNYSAALINAIINNEPPTAACKALDLCSKTSAAAAAASERTEVVVSLTTQARKDQGVAKVTPCAACEAIVTATQHLLGEDKTVTAITTALENVCKKLPFTKECDAFITEYLPQLVELLLHSADAPQICQAIRVCPKKKLAEISALAVQANIGAEVCIACEVIYKIAMNALDNKKTLKDAIAVLDKVCGIVPGKYQKTCDTLVAIGGNDFAMFLLKRVKPSTACKALKACPKTAVVRSRRGIVPK